MKKRRPAVTLKDIAAKTGYSVNTVSRALREKDEMCIRDRCDPFGFPEYIQPKLTEYIAGRLELSKITL